MSHELRTPLNAILGFSEVMKNEVFGPHASPTYREYAGDIHGSGQHLLTLINEILDLSRIEAGRYELNEEALYLAYIVDDCRHMMNSRPRTRSLRLQSTPLYRVYGPTSAPCGKSCSIFFERHQVHAAGRRDHDQGRLDVIRRAIR